MSQIIYDNQSMYHNCDSATNQQPAPSVITYFKKEGTACLGTRVNNTLSSIFQSPILNINLTDKYICIQIRVLNKTRSRTEGGIRICAQSLYNSQTGTAEQFVGGAEDMYGQWECYMVPTSRPSDVTYSVPYNPAYTRRIGVRFWVAENSSATNCFQDFIHVGNGLRVEDAGGPLDEFHINDFEVYCDTKKIGFVTKKNNIYYVRGDFSLNGVYQNDSDIIIVNPLSFTDVGAKIYAYNSTLEFYNVILKDENKLFSQFIDRSSNFYLQACALYDIYKINKSNEAKYTFNNSVFSRCKIYDYNHLIDITNCILNSCNDLTINIDTTDEISKLKWCKFKSFKKALWLETKYCGTIDITFNYFDFESNLKDLYLNNISDPHKQCRLNIYLKNKEYIPTIEKSHVTDIVRFITEEEKIITIDKFIFPSTIIILDSSENVIYETRDYTGTLTYDYKNYAGQTLKIFIYSTNSMNNIFTVNTTNKNEIYIFIDQIKDYIYDNPV